MGHERALAREAIARGTVLVRLLFHDPRTHPLVNETVGVPFDPPHRFEDAWATLRETPRIQGLLRKPVDRAVAGLPGARDALLGRAADPS